MSAVRIALAWLVLIGGCVGCWALVIWAVVASST